MSTAEDPIQDVDRDHPNLRISTPERKSAQKALKAHLVAKRLDLCQYEQRWAACQQARTQAELLRSFADLPAPHPTLPRLPCPSESVDDDFPMFLALATAVALLLGLPVAVIVGFAYGTWWALAVPVAFTVAVLFTEHMLPARRV